MNKKLLILTMSVRQSKYEADRVEEEARKRGVEVWRALYRELNFEVGEKGVVVRVGEVVIDERNLLGIWFRVAGTVSGKYTVGRDMLIRALRGRVRMDNEESYTKWQRMGKISQYARFVEGGVPVIPSRIFFSKADLDGGWRQMVEDLGWPVICKFEKGYQGKGVRKLDDERELKEWIEKLEEKDLGTYMWQKYLPTRWDLRIIVVGGEAIGAMKREAVGEDFRSNYSVGGKVSRWVMTEEEKRLAEQVAEVCGLDYGGVDVMKDENGNNYILEVNRQCQFMGFEKATGVNVAKKVVDMYLKEG